ncbi:MAG: protein-L-isoaspartate O-methyltransferase, partial [Candidatus Portnoybacteria bacterium]|nr:protein-L-isoaspartate O-methyltransferase [Candidatus Portnoybacteria bacterium]
MRDAYLSLVDRLVDERVLRTPQIIEAFYKIHRSKFLPEGLEGQEGVDAPLPIGYSQTISQPYTVAFMFELLQPQKGQTVMDIGYGSGWTSVLLASIVGQKGKV